MVEEGAVMSKTPLFHRAHYNIIAARFREQNWYTRSSSDYARQARTSLTNIALDLAERFQEDNERFDPLKFLDACSPDPERMPLSELWEG
jgi:hypothetical protein